MPGLKPVPASGKHFCLAEEIQKVKVQGGKVTEVEVGGDCVIAFSKQIYSVQYNYNNRLR